MRNHFFENVKIVFIKRLQSAQIGAICRGPRSSAREQSLTIYFQPVVIMKSITPLLALAVSIALAPAQAYAVEGATIFLGPEAPIAQDVGDFPRHDIIALCASAWPGKTKIAENSRRVCESRQNRLAGLASQGWKALPDPGKVNCARRAEQGGFAPYSVLYACVNASLFRAGKQDTIRRIAALIKTQTGGQPDRQTASAPLDSQSVGSIH